MNKSTPIVPVPFAENNKATRKRNGGQTFHRTGLIFSALNSTFRENNLYITGPFAGNPPVTGGFPHKCSMK